MTPPTVPTPSRSWWVGLTDDEFRRQREQEQPRMERSHFGQTLPVNFEAAPERAIGALRLRATEK